MDNHGHSRVKATAGTPNEVGERCCMLQKTYNSSTVEMGSRTLTSYETASLG